MYLLSDNSAEKARGFLMPKLPLQQHFQKFTLHYYSHTVW